MRDQQTTFERYRTEIYRIGWRLQYRVKKVRNRELPIFEEGATSDDFTYFLDSKVDIQSILSTLPENGREIISQIYLKGFTEIEVAKKLNISQQVVNRCKKKMLQQLSQRVSS
ncbi:sigma factor-like helix-turn-helix DNA-binding protein [Paenibacillus polysaccharolyticus]|uniref:sigma factor-like helix-turn-helix DNA-binding protein n=1 Tax=Paenibacillus polysaccharolyticus TaxID=582692 RepID=UPI00280A9221|nr:sigma factor-like helix-turn-helix DNA-binding protein [Paenibacillus polysaccharolyticus]